MRQFMLTRLEKVICGAGAIEKLGEELDRRGAVRALVATSASLGRSRLIDRVRRALGPRCAAVYAEAAQHAPAGRVREMAAMLEELRCDSIVSFGGGSVIDSAKVAVASRLEGRDMTREAGALDFARAFDGRTGPGFVHIAIPTTLSAGAFTPGGGVTDETTRLKRAVIDPRLQPSVVIHDPELCVETPDELWISTGIRVLDHAIETIYAKRAHPLSDALAVRAIRMTVEHLPRSLGSAPAHVEHRGECLDAAWLSLYGAFNTGLGLSHALGHQIGPAWNVPHGVTSCIALVPAMRFMADIVPERFADIAEALRLNFDPAHAREGALACADAVQAFIGRFAVPTKLSTLGIAREHLYDIAEAVRAELEGFDALGRKVTLEEIEAAAAQHLRVRASEKARGEESAMKQIHVKRIYDPPSPDDGTRILVDRLWPRGLRKDAAKIDLWLKEVAPSAELRQWFGHEPQRWAEFRKRYRAELAANEEAIARLRDALKGAQRVTLLFGAKDEKRNNAVVLQEVLGP